MFNVILVFSEDFLDFDVCVRGFDSEEIATQFTNSNLWLCLAATGLDLIVGNSVDPIGYAIDRSQLEVKLDTKWCDRIPLDPSVPESMVKIQQAMVDFENGVENIYNIKEEDYELVDWSFAEIFKKLECSKDKLAIKQYLASGIYLSTTNDVDGC